MMKRGWQIFVLGLVLMITAATFVSCNSLSASINEQPIEDNTTTTTSPEPNPPTETETPTEPTTPVEPTPHEHHYGDWKTVEATCTEPEFEKRTCLDPECDAYEIRATGNPSLGHYYETTVETPATCTATGLAKYVCKICGNSYTEIIPTIDHDYIKTVVDPTYTQNGYTQYECRHCHDTYTADITPALNPIDHLTGSYWYLRYVDAEGNLVGSWAINFNFDSETNQNTYCIYRYSIEDGTFVRGKKLNYFGTYEVARSTDSNIEIVSINFVDLYCKKMIADGYGEAYPYPEFSLQYYTDINENTNEVIHTLQGKDVISIHEDCTFILAGYDL